MTRRLFLFLLAALPLALAAAEPAKKRDLGRNLGYHRVRALPGDLPPTDAARRQPAVLDLRFVAADATSVAGVQAWVRFHATPRTPIFILANAETERELVRPWLGRSDSGSVVVIGRASRGFAPDIAIQTTAEEERRAYDALDAGADLSTLLTDNPGKTRNDEASLSRDRSSEPSANAASADAKDRVAVPPVDVALQRAVHLHRALVALRKI